MKNIKPSNHTIPPKKNKRISYPYALKRQVVNDIMIGIITKEEAKLRYGIKSTTSINHWIRKYANLHFNKLKDYKMKPSPQEQIKALKQRIKHLEDDKIILNLAIDFADQNMNAQIRKKLLPQSLKKSKISTKKGK